MACLIFFGIYRQLKSRRKNGQNGGVSFLKVSGFLNGSGLKVSGFLTEQIIGVIKYQYLGYIMSHISKTSSDRDLNCHTSKLRCHTKLLGQVLKCLQISTVGTVCNFPSLKSRKLNFWHHRQKGTKDSKHRI